MSSSSNASSDSIYLFWALASLREVGHHSHVDRELVSSRAQSHRGTRGLPGFRPGG